VDAFAAIRDEPGNVIVKTIEQFKLGATRAVGLPNDLFAGVARRCWRAGGPGSRPRGPATRAPTRTRSWRRCWPPTCTADSGRSPTPWSTCSSRPCTGSTHADTKVTKDFVAELRQVSGKENILLKMTEAALGSPGERVEDVIYPAVPGGQETLAAQLRKYRANGTSYRQRRLQSSKPPTPAITGPGSSRSSRCGSSGPRTPCTRPWSRRSC